MNRKSKMIALMTVPLAAGAVGQVAQAQDSSVFDPVIVTAQKREQSIYDVPVAISAFSADTIERQGIRDLTDLGKFVPNLNVTEFSAGHTSSANPFIRGIGLQDHLITTDPGVGVYVDGVYLGRQVGQNWSLANIERMEVLRGPQGTLYGRNSIGGAINIITRRPGDEEGGKVSLTAGSRGRLNGELYANMRLSDQFAMSLTGAFQRRDGLGDFVNIANPRKEVGELQDISGRVAFLWTPNDRLSFLLTADANEGDNGLRPYDTLIDEVPNGGVYNATCPVPIGSSVCPYRNSDTASNPYNNNTGQAEQIAVTNEASGVALTVDYKVSDSLNVKLLASDRTSEYSSGLDDDGFEDDFLSFPEDGEADQSSVELQFSGESGAWDYVAGLYYFEEEGQNVQDPTIFLGGAGNFLLKQDMDSQAAYANVGYAVSDQLRLSAGVRYTQDDKTATTIINVIPAPGPFPNGMINESSSRDWSETSWDVSASFKFNDQMTFYGTIQSGYQSGQFNARPYCLFSTPGINFGTSPFTVPADNCFGGNDNVTALNYEAGLKGQPLDNLQMSIAVFYTDYSDLPYQVSESTPAGFDTRNIIVDQISQGIEWESIWQVTDNFRLQTTLGFIDTEVDEQITDPNNPPPSAVAPLTPELTASISPEFTISTGGGEVILRADWSYRDEMYGEPSADPGRFTAIDSRDLINFDISYRPTDGDWTVAAYGRNVTDERYDNARLNISDYVLVILSNDASEFGVRFTKEF